MIWRKIDLIIEQDDAAYLSLSLYVNIMNRAFINKPSGFSVGGAVTVSMVYPEKGKDGRFRGMVYSNDMLPINPATGPIGGSTEYIYVSFPDRAAYDMWLLQGWAIVCSIQGASQNCTIISIRRNGAGEIISLNVSIKHTNYSPMPYEYKIGIDDILAMLVWRVAYQIEATA